MPALDESLQSVEPLRMTVLAVALTFGPRLVAALAILTNGSSWLAEWRAGAIDCCGPSTWSRRSVRCSCASSASPSSLSSSGWRCRTWASICCR
jgi:hypothetical protein